MQRDHPDLVVDPRELFSAEIPDRICAGEVDLGLALAPPPADGVEDEMLRAEPVAALLSARHPLAAESTVAVSALRTATLLLFPRRLTPAYYDGIVDACEAAGFTPDVLAFEDPPVNAMLGRLSTGREVGLAPASFAEHAAKVSVDLVVREVVDPPITAALSMLWPTGEPSLGLARVLATARRHAVRNGWRP